MTKPEFIIAGRRVGGDEPPLVIAEIGINHSGSLDIAKAMVDCAVAHGAEVVKHQTHVVEDEMAPAAKLIKPGNADINIFDIMDSCALSFEDERELKHYTEQKGAVFISTPFSRAAVDRLEMLNVPAYKIGSGECNNYPLVKYIAQQGKPVILSTGMNDIQGITKAVAILRAHNVPYALMHCTNIYPTPAQLVRFGAMSELMKAFPEAIVGLSDHTTSNLACLGAVALGAELLERHFTDSMGRDGPDIICSMDGPALKELKEGAALIKKMRGGTKTPLQEEQATIDFAYASVVTIKAVKKGELLTEDNLWVKRPGVGGILAEHYDSLLGKRATRDIADGALLQFSDVLEESA